MRLRDRIERIEALMDRPSQVGDGRDGIITIMVRGGLPEPMAACQLSGAALSNGPVKPARSAPPERRDLRHRVGDQHDPMHRPAVRPLDAGSNSALPARPPRPSWRIRARPLGGRN